MVIVSSVITPKYFIKLREEIPRTQIILVFSYVR